MLPVERSSSCYRNHRKNLKTKRFETFTKVLLIFPTTLIRPPRLLPPIFLFPKSWFNFPNQHRSSKQQAQPVPEQHKRNWTSLVEIYRFSPRKFFWENHFAGFGMKAQSEVVKMHGMGELYLEAFIFILRRLRGRKRCRNEALNSLINKNHPIRIIKVCELIKRESNTHRKEENWNKSWEWSEMLGKIRGKSFNADKKHRSYL